MVPRPIVLALCASLGGCAWLFDDSVGIDCRGDTCTCGADTASCSHTCTPGQPCSLSCSDAQCAIDCNGASSCVVGTDSLAHAEVNCAGGACEVACQHDSSCTVRECIAPDCRVTCRSVPVVVSAPTITCP